MNFSKLFKSLLIPLLFICVVSAVSAQRTLHSFTPDTLTAVDTGYFLFPDAIPTSGYNLDPYSVDQNWQFTVSAAPDTTSYVFIVEQSLYSSLDTVPAGGTTWARVDSTTLTGNGSTTIRAVSINARRTRGVVRQSNTSGTGISNVSTRTLVNQ